MFVIENGIVPVKSSLLSSWKSTLSEEQRETLEQKQLEEWFEQTLIELLGWACMKKELAKKMCNEVSKFTHGDRELIEIIKEHAKMGSGSRPKTTKAWYLFLLKHYSAYMNYFDMEDYKEREQATIDALIELHKIHRGGVNTNDTMQNQISKAIKEVYDDDPIFDGWREPIEKRISRGKKWNRK
jgi:hypothetical protein